MSAVRFRCASPTCPGLPWKASERPHPCNASEPTMRWFIAGRTYSTHVAGVAEACADLKRKLEAGEHDPPETPPDPTAGRVTLSSKGPLISDATFAKCVRLVSTFAMPNEDRWTIVRELIAGRYAVALDVVRCDDRENATLIEALEEANEEAAREHDRREAEAEPIVQVPRSRPGPRPSREARRRPRARSCRGRAALRPLERPRRAPTEVLLKVGAAWIERLTKERDEARAERDGLRAELAAEKRGRP